MNVYIVIAREVDVEPIKCVCDTELFAMKMKAHFEASDSTLTYEIKKCYVMIEAAE